MHPVVSIVTICRNVEGLVANTVRSVLHQTYPHIEYIIIDGASTDRTVAQIQETLLQAPERKVTLVSEPDQGIADAMNKGARLAKGAIVAYLNVGDRYVDKEVIGRVVKSYREEGWRWAVAASIVVDRAGRPRHIYKPNPDPQTLLRKNSIPHQSTFVVRDIFVKHGLFRVEMTQAMDYEFWLRIAFRGGERYSVLPFTASYYLEGGRSANVLPLLRALYGLRRLLREYGQHATWLQDVMFLSRVAAFHIFMKVKGFLRREI